MLKKGLLILVFSVTFLVSCSEAAETIVEKPDDVADLIWDNVMQFTIYTHEKMENGEIIDSDMRYSIDSYISINHDHGGEVLSETDFDILDGFINYYKESLGQSILFLEGENELSDSYLAEYENMKEIYGSKNLSIDNIDLAFISKEENRYQNQLEEERENFMTQYNIEYEVDDIRYNMANMLDERFIITGIGELSDYYNYGFTNQEYTFSVRLTPEGGNYTDGWYLYFPREANQELYNELLEYGSVEIMAMASVPSEVYKPNQGNMAFIHFATFMSN
ncbi:MULTISPECIES: hypothetical protein [Bacillaceae]|uniref:Uncharacterized protein n=1 Tax=Evansella alkalicola TaxID=745819 RepID=A0ABS6JPR5_9BACI|nr:MULTISPECIES: hypothetical protein [Bacillaceae]MBU9720542.1 hypothetical protein [Bacillus alkalicola]